METFTNQVHPHCSPATYLHLHVMRLETQRPLAKMVSLEMGASQSKLISNTLYQDDPLDTPFDVMFVEMKWHGVTSNPRCARKSSNVMGNVNIQG